MHSTLSVSSPLFSPFNSASPLINRRPYYPEDIDPDLRDLFERFFRKNPEDRILVRTALVSYY